MCDNEIVKSSYFLLKLINDATNKKVEREQLKQYVKEIRDRLVENSDIVLDFDFRENQSDLYSNRLNEVLDFNIGSDFLEEIHGSIHYKITSRGEEFVAHPPEIFEDCLTPQFIEAIQETITEVLSGILNTV